MLNGQPMGGKRRSAYHFDLWCLKYLPKFKWETLTEEIGERCCSSIVAGMSVSFISIWLHCSLGGRT